MVSDICGAPESLRIRVDGHDPGPKPTYLVGFGPGSWKPGLAWPEATTARHCRNSRATTAAARTQSDGLFRGGPYGGGWPIDHMTRPRWKRRKPHNGRPSARWQAARHGWRTEATSRPATRRKSPYADQPRS